MGDELKSAICLAEQLPQFRLSIRERQSPHVAAVNI
jgi:hypothetical protein